MANVAYSHVKTQTEGVIMQRIGAFCSDAAADGTCTSTPYGGDDWQYLPSQVNFSEVLYDRERRGSSAALQFESNDKRVLASLQYTDSQYDNAWLERSSNVSLFGLWATPAYSPQTSAFIGPADGTAAFTFAPNGMLRSGVLTQPVRAVGIPRLRIIEMSVCPLVRGGTGCGLPSTCSQARTAD